MIYTNSKQPLSILEQEGSLREKLATFFLTVPSLAKQTTEQIRETRVALRQLLALENASVIQAAGLDRPLMGGDLAGMISSLLSASCRVAMRAGYPLTAFTAPEWESPLLTAFEPRLIQLAVTGLIRCVCLSNPGKPVTASLYAGEHSLTVSVTGDNFIPEEETMAVIKETARLHQGSLAFSGGTAAFSIHIPLPISGGWYDHLSSDELFHHLLSSVHIGLFSALDPLKSLQP